MTTVVHLVDAAAGWEQRIAIGSLLDRLPKEGFRQLVAALDAGGAAMLRSWGMPAVVLHRPLPITALAAPAIARFTERENVDVIHAWGPSAASAARAGAGRRPIVCEVFDPTVISRHASLLRTLSQSKGFAFICGSGIVQRRLVERGVALDKCAVIRPGIDFAAINRFRRGPLRDELGVPREQTLIVAPEPVTRESCAFEAFSAAAMVNHLEGSVRMIVPGDSPETQRIARFAAGLPSRPTFVPLSRALDMEALIAVSDVLIAAPHGDVSTTAIAWAMAAGVAVIGSAVPSIAELIAHKVNGLLFKPPPRRGVVVDIVQRLRDRDSQTKLKEAARGQAYEVFGLRRFVEQHSHAYDNLFAIAPVGDGVVDSANAF